MYTWIIVLGVIVFAVILYAGKNGNKILKRERPLDILNRRYANGEITKEEYEERKQSINSKK
ncbi:putative membrane protein [Flaviramulus basaltis]|uniref:Putative membrane protein n=2 Tax=Flaviramulus basaltis TaxID=369401 RepID=A0A1K2IQS0_9FLAO|nr:putative membrane protein [Flaviramulus basaltis]|tara:strand:+ start:143 stop:328 length:186 start_codon:yes stop_codon:yes gene_type:complete